MKEPAPTPLHFSSVETLASALARGDVSSAELCDVFARRIESLDGALGAFRVTFLERARERARRMDEERARGVVRGPLHGVPYVAKDLFDVEGVATSAGCRVLESTRARADAHVIRRLDEAGLVLLGKTNTVQFAYGGAGINTHHGTPHNPWHPTAHLPGGSSSGSAVAVAAGMAPLALGTDTGGSVRIPAALCGITGLKTTVGRISRAGVYPLSWSLDSVGPLARTVRDTVLAFDAINGEHAGDASTHGRPAMRLAPGIAAASKTASLSGMRIAVARGVCFDDVDPELVSAVEHSAEVFAKLGAEVGSVEFAQAAEAIALNPRGLIIAAEAYTLNRQLVDEHFDELDPIVAHRIIKGREVTASEYLETVRAWDALRARTMQALAEVDVLLCPTTMIPARPVAPLLEDMTAYSNANVSYLRNTSVGNILNLCGLSVPLAPTRAGLPIGLMLCAKPFDEASIARAGAAFQEATPYHLQVPDLGWVTA